MGHSSLPELPWVAPGFLARWQSQPRSRPSPPRLPQGTDVYVGKHRSALLRAGQGLAALHARLQQLARVMSLPATSIAAALADRVPDGQLGPDARRHLKSSLGMDLWPSPLPVGKAGWLSGGKMLFLVSLQHLQMSFGVTDPQGFPFALVGCLGMCAGPPECGPTLRRDREKGVKVLWLLGAASWPLARFWHHKRVAVAVSHGGWVLGRVRDHLQPAQP